MKKKITNQQYSLFKEATRIPQRKSITPHQISDKVTLKIIDTKARISDISEFENREKDKIYELLLSFSDHISFK